MEAAKTGGVSLSTATAAKPRVAGIDAARFISILGVIWIHCCRSKTLAPTVNLGRFAVPFFTISAAYFACRHAFDGQQSLPSYALSRIRRLYVPFLAWNLIYLALSDLKRGLLTHLPMVKFTAVGFLLNGFSLQLWFLPFILAVSIASFAYGRLLCRCPRWRGPLTVAAALAAFAWTAIPQPHAFQMSIEWYYAALSWAAAPSVLFGCSLFGAMQVPPFELALKSRPAGALGLVVFATAIAFVLFKGRSDLTEALAGLAIAVWAFSKLDLGFSEWLAWFGPFTYGVYLIHAVFVEGIEAVAYHFGFGRTASLDILNLVATTTLSVIACKYLRKLPYIRSILFP